MKRFPFKRQLVILVTGILLIGVMAMASVIPSLQGISLFTPHQVFAGTVPTLKLPWTQGNSYTFTSGPHGAPIAFPCDPSATRTIIRSSGLDFGLPYDTPVLAVAAGWVVFASTVSGIEGEVLAIDHGDGFMTQYWHLHEIDVSVNSWVAQGTIVGKSGNTSGGAHLHLEFRYYRDPNLPNYGGTGQFGNRDFSVGAPYPAHGLPIDGYTVRSDIQTATDSQTDTHLAWNYRGTLTSGTEITPTPKVPDRDGCGTTINEWKGMGTANTIYSTSNTNAPGLVTGSTNTVPTAQPSVIVQDAWTTDANGNKLNPPNYNLNQEIQFWATINNTTSNTVTCTFVWQAIGPRQIMYFNGNESIPPGISTWRLSGTIIPSDAWEGNLIAPNYSFRAQVIYNSLTSGRAFGFTITAPTDTHPTFRIVLTWPGFRKDMDSHLWLPIATPYHVWYQDLGNLNSSPNAPSASLDKDDTSISGMETIGISHFLPGTYYYAVYNFGNTGKLAGSYPGVRVYQNGLLIGEWQAPLTGASNRWWNVLNIKVNSQGVPTVTPIDKIVSTCPAPAPYVCPSVSVGGNSKTTPTQSSPISAPVLIQG